MRRKWGQGCETSRPKEGAVFKQKDRNHHWAENCVSQAPRGSASGTGRPPSWPGHLVVWGPTVGSGWGWGFTGGGNTEKGIPQHMGPRTREKEHGGRSGGPADRSLLHRVLTWECTGQEA